MQRAGQSLQTAGTNLTKAITAPIVGSLGLVGKLGADFEQSFARVKKTVGGTDDDLAGLRQGLIDLSKTPEAGGKTADDLAAIAAAGGQLGIARDDLLEFVRTSAQLAGATGIPADEIGTDTAIIAKLTHTNVENWGNMASAIVGLGNDMAGTESQIIDVSQRTAGTLTALGVKAQDILGIASAVGAIGIEPEAGGTAVQRTFLDISAAVAGTGASSEAAQKKLREYQDRIADLSSGLQAATLRQQQFGRNTPASEVKTTADQVAKYKRELGQAESDMAAFQNTAGGGQLQGFAKIAGVTTEQFKALFREDPTKAFTAVVDGLARIQGESGAEGVTNALSSLGITEQRQITLLLGLASASDQLHQGLSVANQAWTDNTALAKENAAAQETAEQRFQLLLNQLKAIAIEAWPAFKRAATDAFDAISTNVLPRLQELKDAWNRLDPAMQRNILTFAGIAAVLGPAVFVLGLMVTALGALLTPVALVTILIGLLAAAWITNWEGIRDKAGAAIVATAGFLRDNLGKALQIATVAVLVAGLLIIAQLVLMREAMIKTATVWVANAIKMGIGWVVAFAPVLLTAAIILVALLAIVATVAAVRKAWDDNLFGMQQPVADLVDTLGNFFDLLAQSPVTIGGLTPEMWKAQADAAHQFVQRVREGKSAIPALQGVADGLDKASQFNDQLTKGFPDLANTINGTLGGAIGANGQLLAGLGVPASSLAQATNTLAGGAAPTIPEGLSRVGAFATSSPVAVTINNPTVLDQAMLDSLTSQMQTAVEQAMILSEKLATPPPTLPLPGIVPQPF